MLLVSLATLILLFTPYIGEVLRSFNTMMHESGHAIMSLLMGGEVNQIELYGNTEGVTESMIGGGFASILVSLSGYLATTAMMVVMVWMIKREKYTILFYLIAALSIINLVFWIRNIYGFLWITALVGFLSYIVFKKKEWIKATLYSMATIVVIDATRSVLDILYLSYKYPKEAGDATGLSEITMLPVLVCGVVFAIIHIIGLFLLIKVIRKK